jgi:hypothetical protein
MCNPRTVQAKVRPDARVRPRWSQCGIGIVLIGLLCVVVNPLGSDAQDMSTFARLLREGDDFRVRTQAAFGLGRARDPQYRTALEHALRDRHEAVRAAAASSLGQLGMPQSIPALEALRNDSSTAVRAQANQAIAMIRSNAARTGQSVPQGQAARDWSRVRVAVVIGQTTGQQTQITGLVERLRDEIVTNLGRVDSFAVFSSERSVDAASRSSIQSRRIPLVRIDGQLANVHAEERPTDVAVRCDVTLTLLEQPGGNLRGMLRGTATGREERDRDLVGQRRRLALAALASAVRSASSSAERALVVGPR